MVDAVPNRRQTWLIAKWLFVDTINIYKKKQRLAKQKITKKNAVEYMLAIMHLLNMPYNRTVIEKIIYKKEKVTKKDQNSAVNVKHWYRCVQTIFQKRLGNQVDDSPVQATE